MFWVLSLGTFYLHVVTALAKNGECCSVGEDDFALVNSSWRKDEISTTGAPKRIVLICVPLFKDLPLESIALDENDKFLLRPS